MAKNTFEGLTNEKLIKKRDLLRGVSIGFGVVYILAMVVLIYLFATKGSKNISIATLVPVLMLPVTLSPLLINLSLVSKEIKARKI